MIQDSDNYRTSQNLAAEVCGEWRLKDSLRRPNARNAEDETRRS